MSSYLTSSRLVLVMIKKDLLKKGHNLFRSYDSLSSDLALLESLILFLVYVIPFEIRFSV